MDFKRLTNFVRIAESGSLSSAADRMRIAQPALSRQMKLLEQELGVPLFTRHRRGVTLTDAGKELRDRVAPPLRTLQQAIEDVRSLSDELAGNVAFGMPPTVSYILAGALARRVVDAGASVSLRVVEGYGAHLIDWLHRGEIDLAILYGPASDFQLHTEELLLEDIHLVGPAQSALSPDVAVDFQHLESLPLVLPSHPHGLRVVAENAAAKVGMKLQVRFQADSFVLMKELVESGLGYTLLPLSSFSREAAQGRLLYAPLQRPHVTRQLVLATRPGQQSLRVTRRLSRLVRLQISEMVQSGAWSAKLMFTPPAGRSAGAPKA